MMIIDFIVSFNIFHKIEDLSIDWLPIFSKTGLESEH